MFVLCVGIVVIVLKIIHLGIPIKYTNNIFTFMVTFVPLNVLQDILLIILIIILKFIL